ncbi:MAG TPA: Fic family protein [Kofleriaceae bacterium]|jgi:Fic family protein
MTRVQAPPRADLSRIPFEVVDRLRPDSNDDYLHWDELRHRTPPAGASHEQWWSVLKLYRTLAFTQGVHAMAASFRVVMTDAIQRAVHEIDRDASGRIDLPEDVTNKGTRDRYVASSLYEESIRSSQLEGASTTLAVAKEMLRSKRSPRNHGERMILSNYYAMEWVRAHQTQPMTAALLLELHGVVTRDTLDAEQIGRYRRADEPIAIYDKTDNELVYTPPDAAELPAQMRALLAFANGTSTDVPFVHPVVRAILLHLWLAWAHPFVDGNGRTARALFYWSMLKQGYWLAEFISISRAIKLARTQYDRAFIYTETDGNDATYFVQNQLRMLRRAIDELFVYLKRKTEEVRSIEGKLRADSELNHRQLAILTHALRHPDERFTVESHKNSHRIAYETARTDLLGLVEAGMLVETKLGKKFVFTPTAGLPRKLRKAT